MATKSRVGGGGRLFSDVENRFIVAPVALNAPLNFVTMGATAI